MIVNTTLHDIILKLRSHFSKCNCMWF